MMSPTTGAQTTVAENLRVAIVGASLGGLSAANVLHRLKAKVTVFESFTHGFHERGGALGSVNVQMVREIRGDTGTDGLHNIRGHGHFYGDLWNYYYEGLPSGTVRFGSDVKSVVDVLSDEPKVQLADGTLYEFDIIVGADGGRSAIREYVTEELPTYAGYTVWRGLVPMSKMEGFHSAPSGSRTVNGISYQTLGFPCAGPPNVGAVWNCGIYMAMPESDVTAPTKNRQLGTAMKEVPDWFIPFVKEMFGGENAAFWDAAAKHGKVAPHPVWELGCDKVVNRRVALLGDAAHMASPRTGAGAHTAMMDSVMLGLAMTKGRTVEEALSLFNKDTVRRGKQLYASSRSAAKSFAARNPEDTISPAALLDSLTAVKTKKATPHTRAEEL